MENGADIDAISSDRGYSPVMDAVWRKNFDITKYLISKGADLSFVSSDGQPILVLAVGNGNVDIVKILLENGADPDIKDSMGMSAREYALLFKKKPMIELMEKFPKK
ncbi:MAG: ankyrin repeat domain-containing protein [Treponema sp.]|nr:ankyrin repeat domain-containing protein [Treponema sp.]